jgi:hypothetical protein
MEPEIKEAQLNAAAVQVIYQLDYFSEASLGIIDLLMFLAGATGRKLDVVETALVAAAREQLPKAQVQELDRQLKMPNIGNRGVLRLFAHYTGEVACRNMGGVWRTRKKFLRPTELGVEFKSRGKFVSLGDLCGGESYIDVKAELTGVPRDAVKLSSAKPA